MKFNFLEKRKNLKRIKELTEEISKRQEKALVSDDYHIMGSKNTINSFDNIIKKAIATNDLFSLENMHSIVTRWDDYGSISREDGKLLEDLINDDKVVVGIHRTGGYGTINADDVYSSQVLHSILSGGLYITGDISSGVVHKDKIINPNKNISPLNNILTGIMLVKSSYKDSSGGVIVVIPKEYVTDELDLIDGHEKDIYTKIGDQLTLKPEFIIGFISQKNGNCKYYSKEDIINNYKYMNKIGNK